MTGKVVAYVNKDCHQRVPKKTRREGGSVPHPPLCLSCTSVQSPHSWSEWRWSVQFRHFPITVWAEWSRSIMTTMPSVCRAHTPVTASSARNRSLSKTVKKRRRREKSRRDTRKVFRAHCPRSRSRPHCQPELKDLFSSYFPTFGRLQCVP